MAYNTCSWRRAVMVSVLCHIFLLAGAGYLSAQLFTLPIIQEQYVELELMNDSQGKQGMASTPNPASASPTALSEPTTPAAAKITQNSPVPMAVHDTSSVVSTGELAVTSTSSNETRAGNEPIGKGSTNSNAGTSSKPSSIIPPRILGKVAPPYPEGARQAGIEGTVVLKIRISENGRADHISISRSSGNEGLDDAAVATIQQWRFVPAKDQESGQALPCYTTIPISFRLKE